MLPASKIKRFVYQTKRGDIFVWRYRDKQELLRDFGRKASSPNEPFTWWDVAVCTGCASPLKTKQAAVKRPESVKDASGRRRPR